ncbi:MAG: hypothetical protein IPQ14_10710 [Candidatus Microthrix sp.]|uniref:hypothetical protein n=1 Tax=Candidatus Neomicrothrix sp. TaxID=2719034 RepID=UPI0025BDB89F|nr:hypothetical protein [Candidatus Microthrix sp.]MBL0204768.1 hypothetical protein [Candidatus Microthrix sp.]
MTNTIAPVGQTSNGQGAAVGPGALLVTGVTLGAGCGSDDSATERDDCGRSDLDVDEDGCLQGGSAEVGDLKLTEARIESPLVRPPGCS